MANDKTAVATKAKQATNTDPKSGTLKRVNSRIDFLLKTLAAEGATSPEPESPYPNDRCSGPNREMSCKRDVGTCRSLQLLPKEVKYQR